MSRRRATKIVATLGPASSDPAVLEEMIRAGVNVVRLNFSHGAAADHVERARLVREASARAGREVAIMADLQGPKIRVGRFAEGRGQLQAGARFVLDAARTTPGDVDGVGLTCNLMYRACAECCRDDVYQTEDCANYHDHRLYEDYHCPTIRALDEEPQPS